MENEDCVMCGRTIDIYADTHEVGKTLGEYWCEDCAYHISDSQNG
jgi:DNA-directed RNA polymerase subunit RPC12/RpoP